MICYLHQLPSCTHLPAIVSFLPQVPEVPLVVSDAAESITKTSKALELLKAVGADADTEKARDSKALRR
jgi:large subunit ribosomal protein L4e